MRLDYHSVSDLLSEMKQTINQNERLSNIALIGEVSNFSAHRSGHFYFTLKDDKSKIDCVMFKGSASQIIFKPKAGDKVILVGRVDVFEAAGSVQFYASKMLLDGLGQLHQQYEALKLEFQKKGYFDEAIKKPLKEYPKEIAIITGAGSAAYADMMKTIENRWPLMKVHVFYSLVQGPMAKHELVERIALANQYSVDAIVLARGGGSIEDLWAFNEPEVIDAIYASRVPIVSGVGHESDTTLSDLAADVRAATPTAAIVALTPLKEDVHTQLRAYMNQYYLSVKRRYQTQVGVLEQVMTHSILSDPQRIIDRKAHLLDYYKQSLNSTLNRFNLVKLELNQFEYQQSYLLNKRLRNHQEAIDFNLRDMSLNVQSNLQNTSHILKEFQLKQDYNKSHILKDIQYKKDNLVSVHTQINKQSTSLLQLKKKAFADIMRLLDAQSPFKLMAKGYSVTYKDGAVVKSIQDIELNDQINIEYQDGYLSTKVIGKEPKS